LPTTDWDVLGGRRACSRKTGKKGATLGAKSQTEGERLGGRPLHLKGGESKKSKKKGRETRVLVGGGKKRKGWGSLHYYKEKEA